VGDEISSLTYQGSGSSSDVIEKAEDLIQDIRQKSTSADRDIKRVSTIRNVGESLGQIINEGAGAEFPFKFSPLEAKIGGIDRGMLTVIGGFTSQCKTSLVIQLADDFASSDFKTVICSSEMPELQIMQRVLCRRCHIDSENFSISD